MTHQTTLKKSRIPDFKNREEEAGFWDTHDFTEYQDEFKTVKVRFAKKLSHLSETLNIRLDPEDVVKLRAVAHKKGIGPTTLIRMWVREHLQASKNAA
jgi:predicted DNA binding CopG/RHH family protein